VEYGLKNCGTAVDWLEMKTATEPRPGRNRPSLERTGRPRLFADTDHTFKLFDKNSGRLDIRRVAELYNISVSELARLIQIEAKTAHKTPHSPTIHKGLLPFEEVARTLGLLQGEVGEFRRWVNASNAELDFKTPWQMIEEGRIGELAGIVRAALLGQPD
jgi:hypothetical protein